MNIVGFEQCERCWARSQTSLRHFILNIVILIPVVRGLNLNKGFLQNDDVVIRAITIIITPKLRICNILSIEKTFNI